MKIKVNGMEIEGDRKTLRDLLFATNRAPETSSDRSTCHKSKNKHISHGRKRNAGVPRLTGADRDARDAAIVKIIAHDPTATVDNVQQELRRSGTNFKVSKSVVNHACREAGGHQQRGSWFFPASR